MGCFVGCFGGISNKKKRRNPPQRFLLRDIIGHGSYQPLDSFVQPSPPSPTCLISSNNVSAKIKKKVRFDLNVQTYEAIVEDEADSGESCCSNTSAEETSTSSIVGGVDASASDWDPAFPPLPLNNRYENCRGSYHYEEEEDEDEFVLADSDFFDYESDDEEDVDSFDGEEDSLLMMPLGHKTSNEEEDAQPQPRGGGRFAESLVLNPVENLTQWKAIKAKEARSPKCPRFKENIAVDDNNNKSPQCSTIKVNMSLSNWLPHTCTADDDPYLLINNAHTRQPMSC